MIYRFSVDLPVVFMWLIVGYMLIVYWQQNLITTGDLVFVFNSIWAIMFRLWFLGEALAEIFKDYGIASQALSLIVTPYEILDVPNAKTLCVKEGRIAFNEVTFYYSEDSNLFRNTNVLRRIKNSSIFSIYHFPSVQSFDVRTVGENI